jgi:ferric-dicitrate binding protein FerR (iron transport regulator)
LLVFDSEPLREVARAFNRQNAKQLIIADPELQELRISGVFPAAGAGPIAKFLRERFGVHVVETDAAIRIEKPQG